jgi:Rhs element Vgr protein
MPSEQTLPIPGDQREFTVKINGEPVENAFPLFAVSVTQSANKIGAATLVYLDGDAASSDFPLSNENLFLPGQEVEILAGAINDQVSLFKGIVIRQSVKVRHHAAPQLIVECRHKAVKLSVGRKNAYFFDQTDSDTISALLEGAGITGDVEGTTITHKQQVQYHCTDWDFIVARAEANGKLVFTSQEQVTVKAPVFTGNPVCTLQFGATLLELDAEMDARSQYGAVKSFTWDAAQQSVIEKEAADPGVSSPGNVDDDDLAAVIGLDHYPLRHGAITEEEAQAWADAAWLKAKMSKTYGRAKCEGIPTVHPGDLVTLSGVGERYSGNLFVTGVRHDFNAGQGWKTHIQFGHTRKNIAEEISVSSPKAAALLPGVNGLQIGVVVSNEDPDGEDRVRVRMPMVNNEEDGTWARVAALDAGEERGFFFRPEVGDEVVLGFLNDDPRQAVLLGMLHSSAKPAPLTGSDDNHEKVYQSRSKMKLYFDDDKKIMQFETPAGNKMTFSEDEKAITIADQNGNKIAMTSDGITIESSQELILKAATNKVSVESGTALTIKAGTELKLEGSAGAELSSTAVTKVKGSLLQLN